MSLDSLVFPGTHPAFLLFCTVMGGGRGPGKKAIDSHFTIQLTKRMGKDLCVSYALINWIVGMIFWE